MQYKAGKIILSFSVLATFIILATFGLQQPAVAASTSCAEIDGAGSVTAGDWVLVLYADGAGLQPGDLISISVTPDSGAPTLATLQVPVGDTVTTSSVPGTLTYSVTTAGATAIRVFITGGTAVIDWGCGDAPAPPAPPPPPGTGTGTGGGTGGAAIPVAEPPGCANLLDGRINDIVGQACAAPLAIYATGSGFAIYAIDPATAAGAFVFGVDNEQIEATRQDITANQLLGQAVNPYTGQMIMLHLLTTGELQITTAYADGKPYTFVWDENGNKYHLAH